MRAGDVVQSYREGIPQDLLDVMGGIVDPGILAARTAHRGNCLPLHMIPVGTVIYNVGSRADKGAVFCRSAGTYAVITNKEEESTPGDGRRATGGFVHVRLQSGEVRRVNKDACATIGVASNPHHQDRQLGKAGRSRWLNIRPTVRGVAMNRGQAYPNISPPTIMINLPLLTLLRPQSTIRMVVAAESQKVTDTQQARGARRYACPLPTLLLTFERKTNTMTRGTGQGRIQDETDEQHQ